MARKPLTRRGLRLSRPDSERFFTVMLVFSHRTIRWSIARRTMLWGFGLVAAIWAVAMIGFPSFNVGLADFIALSGGHFAPGVALFWINTPISLA